MLIGRLFLILLGVLSLASLTLAQARKPAYGPAATAYFSLLREELQDLDFQLQQREISRADYELGRARMLTLRRLVQAHLQLTRTDVIPELQVITLNEFGMVGQSQAPAPEKLQIGNVFDESWKLVSIEATKPQFYVFEKIPLPQHDLRERLAERPLDPALDPLEMIETIEVVERSFLFPAQAAVQATPTTPTATTEPAATTNKATRPRKVKDDPPNATGIQPGGNQRP